MSKWIIKNNISDKLTKNMILEETNSIHMEAVSLSKDDKSFSFFRSGKNFKTEEGLVVKLIGNNNELLEHVSEYKPTGRKYRWIGPEKSGLFPGMMYEESVFSDDAVDAHVKLDWGISKVYLTCDDKTYCVVGSKKIFNEYMEIILPEVETKTETTPIDEKIIDRKITKIIKEVNTFGITGPEGQIGPRGLPGDRGDKGDAGPPGPIGSTGSRGVGISKIEQIDLENVLIHLDDKSVHPLTLPKGHSGVNGLKGDRGERGEIGPQGVQGEIGPEGPVGPIGPAGPQGEMGDRGNPGVDGKDGKPGKDGKDGKDGIDGKDGKDGAMGPRGPRGPEGRPGAAGIRGVGERGPEGPRGEPGVIKAQYPLIFNEDRGSIELDKKFFESIFEKDSQINQQLINKFINAASSGGGGIGVIHKGIIQKRSSDSIDFTGEHFEILDRGRWVEIRLKEVPKMFVGVSADVTGGTYATGDFHLNTSTSILYTRIDNVWVEV